MTEGARVPAVEKHVLIVDDSNITRQILCRLLRDFGFTKVLEAKDGHEALDRVVASSPPIGLILLDWNMPRLSGVQFLARLKPLKAARRIPVIMVSAESSTQRIMEALAAGAKGYVIKPFHPNELRVKILEALRLGDIEPPRTALSGSLADVGLPALVQLMSAAALSGMLSIAVDGAPVGEVGLAHGEVRTCRCRGAVGDEAFLDLASLCDGRFDFVAGDPPAAGNVLGSTVALLMEAMRRQDERLRAERCPGPEEASGP